jgi:micrococcal nuclease
VKWTLILVALILTACAPSDDGAVYEPPDDRDVYEPPIGPPDVEAGGAVVARVVDGDTVDLTNGTRIRLIGIDTPEVYGGVECGGREASAFTTRKLAGERVRLEYDEDRIDPYGRTLAYVVLEDGRMFNRVLVARGFATVATYPPNVRYVDAFERAEDLAKAAGRGLWGQC